MHPSGEGWKSRVTHSAHHRGQLTVYLRLLGRDLYSTYGPTADTGGLPQNQAKVIYRYDSLEELGSYPDPAVSSEVALNRSVEPS